ncbi:hypothetical protein BN1708_011015, partial [Verticillium longisporum]
MISSSVSLYAPAIASYVARAGLAFFSVEYRLAPGHPGDGPVADVYAALGFFSAYAADWNVDPRRLAITGDSAGGGLAAGAALLVRDGNLTPPLAKQLLIYPMLDDRTGFRGGGALDQYHFWTAAYNRTAWEAVLGAGRAGAADAGSRSAWRRDEPATCRVCRLPMWKSEDWTCLSATRLRLLSDSWLGTWMLSFTCCLDSYTGSTAAAC